MLGEERESVRIARELHDGIGGALAAIKMNFGALRKSHPDLSSSGDFNDTFYMLNEVCSDVRKTAHSLMPDVLERYGLAEALQLYCDNINKSAELQVDLQVSANLNNYNKSFRLSLYRIVQELLQNVLKHAGATNALVQVIEREDVLSLLVEDNGTGFGGKQIDKGIGLQNVDFRIKALNGDMAIQSNTIKGTLIYIKFYRNELKSLAMYGD